MKHLFYIHSYVTYLVTLGVVEHHRIKDEDIVLVYGRGGVSQNRFKAIDVDKAYPDIAHLPTFGTSLMFLKKFNHIALFDNAIKNLVENKKFICYLPSNNHFLLQLLATHSLCNGVNFIEEGLFTYNNNFYKKNWPFEGVLGLVKRVVNTGCRNVKPEKLVREGTLFTLFDTSVYGNSITKECVMPVLENISYPGIILAETNLLLLNAFKDVNESVRHSILDVLADFAVNCKEIYIKHHPYADSKFKKEVEQTFARCGTNVHVIPEDAQTELMLFKSKNLNIYGFFSAAMMYGALFGHKAYSFTKRFEHKSPACASYLLNNFAIPDIFFKHVNLL